MSESIYTVRFTNPRNRAYYDIANLLAVDDEEAIRVAKGHCDDLAIAADWQASIISVNPITDLPIEDTTHGSQSK